MVPASSAGMRELLVGCSMYAQVLRLGLRFRLGLRVKGKGWGLEFAVPGRVECLNLGFCVRA